MAEEVKKIITVEVGKSITSVRDFKKHIEDLRGALLGLNEESDEYKQIAEQIATDQAKLNEVMKVGKGNTDSAAGSYNELNNQLKALRQQYKALSETERNSATGQAILQNITKLDTELKDIDESMGQYYRNVGNYKGAFEEAFKAMAQNIGNINPELGKLMKTASSLIPLIKSATKAATTGLKGIKAGLASTGIGLLVVALGEIVANWEQIYNWIQKVLGKQKDLTDEIKNSKDAANDLKTSFEEFFSTYNDIWIGLGYSSEQMAQSRVKVARQAVSDNERQIKQLEEYKRLIDEIDKTNLGEVAEGFKEVFTGDKEGWNREIKAFWELVPKIEKDLKHKVDSLGNEISRLGEKGGVYLNSQLHFGMVAAKKEIDKDIKDLKDKSKDLESIQTQAEVAYKQFQESALESARENVKQANDAVKGEIELRQEKYRQEYFDFSNRIELQKQYTIESIEDEEARNKVLISLEEEKKKGLLALEKEYNKDISEIRKKQWESSDAFKNLEKDKEDAKSIYDSLKDYGEDELELLDKNYVEQLVLLEKFHYDTTNLTKKWQDEREKIVLENYQKEQEELKQQEEAKLQIKREAFQKSLDLQSNTEFLDTSSAETMWTINTKTHETDETLEYQKQDRLYEIAEKGYQDRIELYQKYLSNLKKDSDEYLDISRELHEEEMGLAKLQYDYQVELEDRLLEKKRKNLQIMQGMFQAYGELGSTVAGLIADASEEGTERWKAARITETVINTISGAAGAFMQGMSSYPQPWGAIIGAAGAAVATATGAAQIAKIKSTQIGTSSVSGIAANSSGVGVEPLLNPDYDLQRITNLSLQSDEFLPGKTQVYVLESDIQEVGNRVQVRENNATF